MEHDTTLWTTPYNDEKYGEERGASFKYFKCFIKCPTPRTLVHFHKVLSQKLSQQGRARIPSLQTLQEYSHKWNWFKRMEAYDAYIQDVDDAELKKKIKDIRTKAINMMDERFDFHEELQKQLQEDTEMNTNQKVYGFSKNAEGLKNDITSFNDLVNEGKTKLDAEVESTGETSINVTGNISVEDKLEKYETYFKSLDSKTESDTS